MERPLYIASCSFGKDSLATILLAKIHNEPLDRIVTAEVMYDHQRGISGEEPEHMQWVRELAIPRLKELTGIETEIVRRPNKDYRTSFFHVHGGTKEHPERKGLYRGYPIASLCIIRSELKLRPLADYFKQYPNCIQYVGIAADELNRLARLDGVSKVSLLAKYGYTEKMAFDLCAEYDLLSPSYKNVTRGGCWFCPNKTVGGFCKFREHHPDLWEELRELSKVENVVSNNFSYGKCFAELEKRMNIYERQLTLF